MISRKDDIRLAIVLCAVTVTVVLCGAAMVAAVFGASSNTVLRILLTSLAVIMAVGVVVVGWLAVDAVRGVLRR